MHLVAIGGSDAGISAALRARELDSTTEVTVVVADAYPNFSICGIPYYVSGEVTHWRNLAHRTLDDLKATGMQVRLNTTATKIDVAGRQPARGRRVRREDRIAYDQLVVGTGAASARPPIEGLVGPDAPGSGRRRAPAPLHGRHLRAGAHAGGGPASQRGDRRSGLHRPRNGGGPSCSRAVRHPVRAAARGAPDRGPQPGRLGQCRAQHARRRGQDQHDGQAHRSGPEGFGRSLPDRRRRVDRFRVRPSSPTWCSSWSGCGPTPPWRPKPGLPSASAAPSAWTGACAPTSRASSPPGTAS